MAESFDWVDQELEQINKSLSRCKLYRRDNRFVVRGYFPSKPGHVNQSERRHQVALNLTATKTGLKAAIATAKEIDGLTFADVEGHRTSYKAGECYVLSRV